MLKRSIKFILLTFLIGLILVVICALPIMLLWNWLMPIIFGLPTITFWQAFGINLLFSIFFKTNVNITKDR